MNKNYKKLRYSLFFTALIGGLIIWILYPPFGLPVLFIIPDRYFIGLQLIKGFFYSLILVECIRNIFIRSTASWSLRKHLLIVLAVILLLTTIKIIKLPQSSFHYGWLYDDKGNYREGVKYLDLAIKLNSNYEKAYEERAWAFNALGNYKMSIADYDKAIQLKPNDYGNYIGRGWTYYDMGDYTRAMFDYNKAIQLNPKYAKGYADRGNVYYSMHDYEKALLEWKQAIVLDPSLEKKFKKWMDDAIERNKKYERR